MRNVTSIRIAETKELDGLPDCWDGVVMGSQKIYKILCTVYHRPLTDKERYELQYELENFIDFSDMTKKACAGMFLSPEEYKKQEALDEQETQAIMAKYK